MIRPRNAVLAFALLLVGALGAAGCLTPSVPIPPPEPEKMSFSVDPMGGTARYSYAADPSFANAVVYVFNRTQGVGVITTANNDGSVDPTEPFAAELGNQVVVTFELDDQLASTCVEVRDGRLSSQFECPL